MAEYIWIDADGETRSKSRVCHFFPISRVSVFFFPISVTPAGRWLGSPPANSPALLQPENPLHEQEDTPLPALARHALQLSRLMPLTACGGGRNKAGEAAPSSEESLPRSLSETAPD